MRLGSEAMTSSLQKLTRRALTSMAAVYGGAVAVPPEEADAYLLSPRRPAEQACRNSIADIFGNPFHCVRATSAHPLTFEAQALSDLRADLVSSSGQGHHRS